MNQAILVGMVTPLSAAMSGVLPLPLLAMIPFIAMGNATLVSVYGALRARNRWLALGGGAVLKFALLATVVTLLVARPLSVVIAGQAQPLALPVAIVEMMRCRSWPRRWPVGSSPLVPPPWPGATPARDSLLRAHRVGRVLVTCPTFPSPSIVGLVQERYHSRLCREVWGPRLHRAEPRGQDACAIAHNVTICRRSSQSKKHSDQGG